MTRPLLLIIIYLILNLSLKAQSGCTLTTTPTGIYYPYSTSNYTFILAPSSNYSYGYMCGPNTILYDTTGSGCRIMYVNSGCSLTVRYGTCLPYSTIYAKSNSTVNILPGSSNLFLYYEPSVTINNQSGIAVNPLPCLPITFPLVNCSNGINEIKNAKYIYNLFPNPTSTAINIYLLNSEIQVADVIITNQLGEIIYERKQWSLADKEIPIDNLSNGSYFIQVKTKLGQQTEKLIVIR